MIVGITIKQHYVFSYCLSCNNFTKKLTLQREHNNYKNNYKIEIVDSTFLFYNINIMCLKLRDIILSSLVIYGLKRYCPW